MILVLLRHKLLKVGKRMKNLFKKDRKCKLMLNSVQNSLVSIVCQPNNTS